MNESQLTCSMSYLCQIGYLGHFGGVEPHFSKVFFFNKRAASLGMLAQEQEQPCSDKQGDSVGIRLCLWGRFPNTGGGRCPLSPQTRHWQMPDMHLVFQGGCVPILLYTSCTLNCAMLSPAPLELDLGAAGSTSHTGACGVPWAPGHLLVGLLQKGPMLGANESQLSSLDCRFLTLMNMKKSLPMWARCFPKAQKTASH